MTSIKYIDSKLVEHELQIDDDASETEFLTIYTYFADLDKLSTIEGKREIAYAVCQVIPNLPRNLGYFEGEYKFKMPPMGVILELGKVVVPKVEKLTSVAQRLKDDRQKEPELTPEEKEALELEARLAELRAKQNTAGVGFGNV